MTAPLVSIIVPVYRAMPFLPKCLDSLLLQSVIDRMEIICVDDCGGDGSAGYIRSVQERRGDGVVRLFSMPQNMGAAAARNFGLGKARGRYVGFVDADDWCEPDMYGHLIDALESYDAEWAYCRAQKDFAGDRCRVFVQPGITGGLLSDSDRRLLLTRGIAYFTTGLYSRKFLADHGIMFPDGKFSEDSYFWWTVLMHSHRLAVVDRVGYHYVVQNDSVSRRPDPDKAVLKQSVYSSLVGYLRSNGLYDSFAAEIDYLYIKKGLLIPLLVQAINQPDTFPAVACRIFARTVSDGISISGNPYFRSDFRSRMLYLAFSRFPACFSRLLRLKFRQDPF